jgi:hypothetical protein
MKGLGAFKLLLVQDGHFSILASKMKAKSLGTIVITITLDVNPLKNVFYHALTC